MKGFRFITLTLLLCFNSILLWSQMNYESTKKLASEKLFESALKNCEIVLGQNPQNTDFLNLRAWIYSQQGQYTEAIKNYLSVLEIDPKNYDALSGISRAYLWSGLADQSLEVVNTLIRTHPQDLDLLWLKVQSLVELNQFTEAVNFLDQLMIINPDYPNAISLRKSIIKKARTVYVSYNHSIQSFESFYNTLELNQLGISKNQSWGSVGFRIQKGVRSEARGWQYEFESYPRLWKGAYGHFNLGISNGSVFSEFIYGLEINQNLFKIAGVGLGYRSMKFPLETVNMIKISSELYINSYRIAPSFYQTFGQNGSDYTFIVDFRRYFNKSSDFATILFGNGFLPGNQNLINALDQNYLLKNKLLTLGFQKEILNGPVLSVNLTRVKNELPFDQSNFVKGFFYNLGLNVPF